MYYAQFRGKLSNSKKELILASLFHLREADILLGDWHSCLVRSLSWHTSVSPLLQTNKQTNILNFTCLTMKFHNRHHAIAHTHGSDDPVFIKSLTDGKIWNSLFKNLC